MKPPLPERCPCGGPAIRDEIKPQYQEDIVRKKIVRQFDVEIGHCACCGKRLQGRHSLQTSDALDAAQVQVGPEALTLAVHLNKQLGISYGNAATVLRIGYGLRVSRGGLCRAVARMGKTEPTYQALVAATRQEAVVWMDETGWKVDAVLRWMWVAVSPHFTVYAILPGRGFAQASALIGADYAGGLEHDGWRVYYQFAKALHQSCLGHIVRRCQDLVEIVSATAAAFPLAVLGLLEKLWLCEIATRQAKFPYTASGLPPGGSKPNWTGYWTSTTRQRRTAVWPSIWIMNFLICSPSCIVRAWKRPTIEPSGPSGPRSWPATSAVAVAPGMVHASSRT